jgi:hypothetical protein
MVPVVNNQRMDEWIHRLEESDNVSPHKIQRVRQLACEANSQWKRKVLVQRMSEIVQREKRLTIPIQDISDVYGVHFTTETMQILEDGIQQSLRNFCRMLKDTLSTWDADRCPRRDDVLNSKRVSLLVSHAPSCLWGSLDTNELCEATVHARVLRAVEGLWNTHAKPAIESEYYNLAEGMQRLGVVLYICDEYLRPYTGGKVVPSRFSGLYARAHQRVIAALAWLLGSTWLLQNVNEIDTVKRVLDAYKLGDPEARASMDDCAPHIRDIVLASISTLKSVYTCDKQWHGWHGVHLWGSDEHPPQGIMSALVLQPPSYSSSFWATGRVYCGVFQLSRRRDDPVVRYCAILRKLVEKRFLRLDLVGIDYLRLLCHADYARYHRNVNKIVEDELVPIGHLAGHAFDAAWFLDTHVPAFCSIPRPCLSDLSLVFHDDEPEQPVALESSETGLTDGFKHSGDLMDKHAALPAPVPEGVVLDYCLLAVLALLAKENINRDHMGPYCNTFHIGTADVDVLLRNHMGECADSITPMCLNQRLSGVFKMFASALEAQGMQASFGTDGTHARVKKLKVCWPMGPQHRAKSMTKLAQLAETIATHLRHGTALPEGVRWNIPDRSRRRRRARDAKAASDVLLRRGVN